MDELPDEGVYNDLFELQSLRLQLYELRHSGICKRLERAAMVMTRTRSGWIWRYSGSVTSNDSNLRMTPSRFHHAAPARSLLKIYLLQFTKLNVHSILSSFIHRASTISHQSYEHTSSDQLQHTYSSYPSLIATYLINQTSDDRS
jgi:hypothetical protein